MTEHFFIIVGLGNPGREYRQNRHNIGFMLVDRLAVKLDARFTRLQSKALVASTVYSPQKGGAFVAVSHRRAAGVRGTNGVMGAGECKIILAKPQTFMNLSGQSVQGLVRFYKLPLTNLLVAHDDLDLPPGAIRIRPDGGSAGQKGMESIIERLGTDEFPRLRLGIGRPPGRMEAPDYVLQDFSAGEMTVISETLDRAVEAALTFVIEGLEAAMNRYNGQGSDEVGV